MMSIQDFDASNLWNISNVVSVKNIYFFMHCQFILVNEKMFSKDIGKGDPKTNLD